MTTPVQAGSAPHPLQALLAPTSVALVGASERAGSVGRTVLANLRGSGFQGPVYAVNPKHRTVDGEPCYPSLESLPQRVDLAVIVAPAHAVPKIVEQAVRARTRAIAVISAGFAEAGDIGRALERETTRLASEAGIPLLGPNMLGLLRPAIGLNASFARGSVTPGGIALVSQSGAICTSFIDQASAAGLGLSSVVSLGSAAMLDFGEILDFYRDDALTRSVLLYVEGVKHGRSFTSALRALARVKPVVVLKVGRHASSSRAARSHTGALVGNDAVFDAVLRRCGVVRVHTSDQLFGAARALAVLQGSSVGNRVAIVTNGGGPGALAADAVSDAGLELARLAPETIAAMDAFLPANWSHANPADLIGDADGERFAKAIGCVSADPNVDLVLTAYAPTSLRDPLDIAAGIVPAALAAPKPVGTAWLGGPGLREARLAAERAGLATFFTAESAIDALGAVARWSANRNLLLQAPPAGALHRSGPTPVAAIFKRAVSEGRRMLTEVESKELLAMFGIPVPALREAATRDEAVAAARSIGYPVALKVDSRDIPHKSDVDGVRLGLADDASVERAFDEILANAKRLRPEARVDGVVVQALVSRPHAREVLVGIATDPVFGPVVTFGAGGVAVELLADHAVALPPLNGVLAEDLIDRTRVAKLLGAYRNVPAASREAIVDVLLRISELACRLPWVAELDVNPLLVDASGAIALDARVVIDPSRSAHDARWSHLAIHPYPVHLERAGTLRSGDTVRVRPIRPEDAPLEEAFLASLSDEARYGRFHHAARYVSAIDIARFTQLDYDRDLALAALAPTPDGEEFIGVARYVREADPRRAEFAIVIRDDWQGKGLGSLLMQRLEEAAHSAGIDEIAGRVLASNRSMLALMRSRGYRIDTIPGESPGLVMATYPFPRKECA